MSIWFSEINLDEINSKLAVNLADFFNIKFTDIGDDFIIATMPVNEIVKQPLGILHGGASCVLAETAGSVAGTLCIDESKFFCVGLELNANHIKSVSKGCVTATAESLHLGSSTQVWNIKIEDEVKNLICVSRLTLMVRSKNKDKN